MSTFAPSAASPATAAPRRMIGYARLSDASEESTSIARQEEIITATAAARGVELVRIIVDPSISASKRRLQRPGIVELRRALAEGEADAVLVWRLDRLARSVVDFGTLLDEGVHVISCTEPLDTTSPMGRAMAEILQVFASMESTTIAARATASVDYLRRNGRFAGGTPPFGYRPADHPGGAGRVLELDPATAPVLREAVDRVLAGHSLTSVAADFTARGIRPRRADRWTASTLRDVLLGDAILGRTRSRGELVRDEHGIPATVWPPIITPAEGRRLRELFPGREAGAPKRVRRERLLSGVVRCAGCDGTMNVHTYGGTSGRVTYTCSAKVNGRECEAPASITAPRLERFVELDFLRSFGGLPVYRREETVVDPVELVDVEEALAETARELTAPGADVPALFERLTSLRARRDEVAARPVEVTVELVDTGRTYGEEWSDAEGDVVRRRRMLEDALGGLWIEPATKTAWNSARIDLRWRR